MLRFVLLVPVLSFLLARLGVEPVLSVLTARISGRLIGLFGSDVAVQGAAILGRRFSVEIYYGCDAEDVIVLFSAAVLAFPASWRAKLVGIAPGILLILGFNLVRILSLFYIGTWAPAVFDATHYVIWQLAGIMFTMALFLVWLERVAGAR